MRRVVCKMSVSWFVLTLTLSNVWGQTAAATTPRSVSMQFYLNVLQAECSFNGPLGMSTGAVSDSQISASSTYPANWDAGCSERYGRLYQPDGRGWCAKFKTASEWLQVDLGLPAKDSKQINGNKMAAILHDFDLRSPIYSHVTGVMTQGRADGSEWVTSFVISHSLDGFNWHYIVDQYSNKRVFEGNTDAYSVKHTYLDNVIILRYIKFHTVTWNRHPSMRVEVIGCQACKMPLALPPYAKVQSSSDRHSSAPGGQSTCAAEFGYIITDKAWCPKQHNGEQWLQFDIGPPKLVTGLVTKGRGDNGKKHWVTKYRVSYSNDSRLWHFYSDNGDQQGITDFIGNVDKENERFNFLNQPIIARYIRFHPVEWNRSIALRAGIVGCSLPSDSGECSEGFVRVNDNSPCVENLAYKKESFVNSRRQFKRHILDQSAHRRKTATGESAPSRVHVDGLEQTGLTHGGLAWTAHGCTVLDNFYVERPVWMVDLGKKTTVSGVIIFTWPGNPNEMRAGYQDYIHNLDKLTVYVSSNNHHSHYSAAASPTHNKRAAQGDSEVIHPDSTVCGVRTRAVVATVGDSAPPSSRSASSSSRQPQSQASALSSPFPPRIHVPCRQPLKGRYVFVEASGLETRWSRLFGAILCDVIVYQ